MLVSKKVISLKLSIVFIIALTLITGCSSIANKTNKPFDSGQSNIGSQEVTYVPKPANTENSSNSSTTDDKIQASNNTSKGTDSQSDDTKKVLLNNIMSLAKEGKVINCDFKVKANVIGDVEKKWGNSEKSEWIAAAKGMYSTYPSKSIAFGSNKGSQIFEIRSFDNQIKKISLSEVKKIYGTPAYDVKVKGEEIIGYVANADFKILLVFPEPTPKNSDPLMDHYSVFYPKGTVNSMADDPGREW
jgi:hypothetical protein